MRLITFGTMWMPGWYAVLDAAEVPREKPLGIERFGRTLAVFRRSDGQVAILDDRCPHRGASLSLGLLKGDHLACPFHGFEFDAKGACRHLPVLGDGAKIPKRMCVAAYEAREADGWIFLWWGERPETLPSPPRFAILDGPFVHSTLAEEWDASMARVLENQLDPFHLPFVHATSIGRGMPPAMTVQMSMNDERLRVWTGEDTERNEPFYIELRYPNLWVNHIATRFSIVAAFAPINATRTRTYLRSYQRFLNVPGARLLAGLLLNWRTRRIFDQDRRVVVSQPQGWPEPGHEVLVAADRPIAAWRKLVQQRCQQAAGGEPDESGEPADDEGAVGR
jgi:phenylpropionate dioxygenase-like ring-hydroxylating dioxygenase large terminal subunit